MTSIATFPRGERGRRARGQLAEASSFAAGNDGEQCARLQRDDPDGAVARRHTDDPCGDADELLVVTITHDYADRERSYELLAAEFELS